MVDGTFTVLLTFHYPDEENEGLGNGIVDGTNLDEDLLAVYYTEDGVSWTQFPTKEPTTVRDTAANTITVLTDHFTDFALSSSITVQGYDLTPDYAQNGADVQILGLLFNNTGPTTDWINRLFITFTGTTTADVHNVEFYYDSDDNGVFDVGSDARIDGTQTWSGNQAGRTFASTGPNRWINTGESQWVFAIYNTTASAGAGDTIGGYIATGDLGLFSSGVTTSVINAGGLTILDASAPETLGASATPNPTKDNLNVSAAAMDDVGVQSGKVCLDNATVGCVGITMLPTDGTPGGVTETLSASFSTIVYTEGLHTLYFRAMDMAMRLDLTPIAVLNVMFDHSAPVTSINAVPSILTISTWTFNGTSIDLYTRIMNPGVSYQLDASGWHLAAPIDGAWDELNEDYRFTLSGIAEGEHSLFVRASDEPGNVEEPPAVITFCVDTVWPIAVLPATYTTDEGTMLVMNASASYDPTANCGGLTYEWFIDGVSVATGGDMFGTTWGDNGVHTVTIQVTDAAGHATNASTTVTVLNVAPTVTANDVIGTEGSAVTFTATFTDPATTNDEPYAYTINWGDGSSDTIGSVNYGVTVSEGHTYVDNGTYTINVSVTDNDGGMGSDTAIASIANVAPTPVIVTLTDGLEGGDVFMNFTFSDPANAYDNPYLYTINWGDGTAIDSDNTTIAQGLLGIAYLHPYADNGNYTVTVTVTDKDGGVGTTSDITEILNVAPNTTVLSPNGGELWNGMRSINWTFNDPGADTYTCLVRMANTTYNGGVEFVSPCAEGDNGVILDTTLWSDGITWRATVEVTDDDAGVGFDLSDDYFTIDNTAPVSSIAFGMPVHNDSGTIYINATTPVTLSATDNIVGVNMMYYAIDMGAFNEYTADFTLAAYPEGLHIVRFYSVDNLGNAEVVIEQDVIMDNSIPDASIVIGDPKVIVVNENGTTTYVTNTTQFNVTGVDYPTLNSSVQYCQYGIDGVDETINWTTASEFTPAGVSDGVHTVHFRCIDNLNQTGVTESQQVTVDSTAPQTLKMISEPRYPDGTSIFSTDFESDNGGFIPTGYWGWGTPNWDSCNSGTKCWGARLDTTYTNYEDDVLLKGTIGPLTPSSKLSFAHRMSSEAWWDGGYVEVSDDGGSTWTKMSPSEGFGYNNADCSSYVGGGPCFTGGYSWTNSTIDLSSYAGETIDVRFRFRTDFSVTSNGWLIDDVSVGDSAGTNPDDVYVNSSTTFTMTAQDAIVGFNATYFRIDGGAWNLYEGPFSLPAIVYLETNHVIEFYSNDLLGNTEATQDETDYLDNSVPDTTLAIGTPGVYSPTRNVTWINSSTDLSLSAVDYPLPSPPGYPSGVQSIFQLLDGGSATLFTSPVLWMTEGPHTMGYYAVDNLDQIEGTSTDGFIVDNTPPVIQSFFATNPAFSPDGNGVKDNTTFVFNATDNLATEFNELEYWIYIRDSSSSIIRSLHTLTTSGEGEQMFWNGDGYPDGNYTVQLIVKDAVGYNTTQTIEVVIDTVDPELDNIFVGQTWVRVGMPFYVEAVASDNNGFDGDDCALTVIDTFGDDSFVGYTDYSAAHGRCRGYATLTESLENGFGSLELVLEDAAGNSVSGVYSPLGIDTVVSGPQMTVQLVNHIVTPGQLIGFNISVAPEDMSGFDGFCYVRVGSLGWSQYTMSVNGVCEGQYMVPVGYPSGTTPFEAGLKDNVGNWNTTDDTTILQVDGLGPSQLRLSPIAGSYYSNSLPIDIVVNDTPAGVNDSTVVARIYHVGFLGLKVDDVPTTILVRGAADHFTATFNITALDETTQYYFSHKSADNVGNVNDTDWNSVPFGIDKTAPYWNLGASLSVTNTPYDIDGNVVVSWPAASDAKSGIARYDVYVNGVLNQTTTGLSVSWIDLPDGVYTFAVEPIDGAGVSGVRLTGTTTVQRSCAVDGTCVVIVAATSGGGRGGGGGGGGCGSGYSLVDGSCKKDSSTGSSGSSDGPRTESFDVDTIAPSTLSDGGGSDVQNDGGDNEDVEQLASQFVAEDTPSAGNLLTGEVTGGGVGASMWWLVATLALILVGLGVWYAKRK